MSEVRNGGIAKSLAMLKVLNFAEIAPNIGFSEFDFYDLYRSTFEKSELGRMKKLLPLHEMAENFGLVSKSMRPKLGRKSYFTPEGEVALMSLKMYTDAICHESEMRYPADSKLLWEGIEKSYETMCELSRRWGIHRPRTKSIDVQKANLTSREKGDLEFIAEKTEILYIFFGIHTANVVQLADRIEQRAQLAVA